MRTFLFALTSSAAFTLTACGGSEEKNTPASSAKEQVAESPAENAASTETTTSESEKTVSEPAETVAPTPALEGEALLKRGRIVFLRCRSCHTLKESEPHLTGPNLHGLVGAVAGVKEGYNFSDALTSSNITWSNETLDKWIESPADYLPGNRMVFAGLPKEQDRAALIAYLAEETK